MANSAPSSDHKELKAQWPTTPKVPTMTLADVQKHKSADDLWIVIHGKGTIFELNENENSRLTSPTVYDVTSYARDHPGGAEALVEVAGQDATSAYEDVGHSEDAREIMNGFLVGVLSEPLVPTQKKATVQLVPHAESKSQPSTTSTLLTPRNELITFAAGTVLLVWALQHIRIGDVLSASVPKSLGHQHGPGFTSGFMLASTTCAAVGIMGFRYFNNETARRFGGDFTSYPAHIPVSHLVAESSRPGGVLKAQVYQKFPLVQKVELAKDIYRFVFQLPRTTSVLGLPIGQHVAIRGYFKDEEGEHTVGFGRTKSGILTNNLQITRSYTPVSNNSDLGRLELVIRCYPDGKLTGKYLSQLKIGDEVEFRGPKGAMTYRKNMSKKLGMVRLSMSPHRPTENADRSKGCWRHRHYTNVPTHPRDLRGQER